MTDPTIEKLRAKEAQIKKRIREIQSRVKSEDRKYRRNWKLTQSRTRRVSRCCPTTS